MVLKLLTILLVNLIFYFKTLRFKYVSDDIPVYQKPPVYKNKLHKYWLLLIGASRSKPEIDHLITMLIHATICMFIYLAFGANNISFLAALLYTFNPTNNQGSVWIAGRGYTLPTLLLLISMYAPILAVITLLACSSFTVGYLAPIALVGSNSAYLLVLMPLIWIFHAKKFKTAVINKLTTESYDEDKKIHLGKLVLAVKTMGFYFTLCLVPFRTTFYHNFIQSCSGNDLMKKRAYSLDKFFWIGISVLTAFVLLALKQWNITTYGMLWFFICILPFCNLRRNNQEIADRFTYMANVGVMIFLASLIVSYPLVIVLFLTMYATKMWFSMEMYKDDYWIIEYSCIDDPLAWYVWHIRGMKRWDNGSYKEALIMWVMAKMISPREFKVLVNIAIVLKLLKNTKEAEEFLKQAEANMVAGQEQEAKNIIDEVRRGKTPILL